MIWRRLTTYIIAGSFLCTLGCLVPNIPMAFATEVTSTSAKSTTVNSEKDSKKNDSGTITNRQENSSDTTKTTKDESSQKTATISKDNNSLLATTSSTTTSTTSSSSDADSTSTTDPDSPAYITPGTPVPINCSVPTVWDAANVTPNDQFQQNTTLYRQFENNTTFLPVTTSGLYTGQGAWWQYPSQSSSSDYWGYYGWYGGPTIEGTAATGYNNYAPVTNVQYSYNALGYDPVNHLLYAVTNSCTNTRAGLIITIDGKGIIRRTGVYLHVPPLEHIELQSEPGPTNASLTYTGGINVGFFTPDGTYYIECGSKSPKSRDWLYKVNLQTGDLTPIVQVPGAYDMTYSNGYAYTIISNNQGFAHAGQIAQVNLQTKTVKYFSATFLDGSTFPQGHYGAGWTYGNGNIGFDANSGGWYEIHINNPDSANPTGTVVAHGPGPASSNNDGASCAENPTDFSIKKTQVSATPDIGGQVTWKIVVTNNGPGISSGYYVSDTMPTGFTYSSAGTALNSNGAATTGSQGQCYYNTVNRTMICMPDVPSSGLNPGTSITYYVTATAPDTADCYQNTATVVPNEKDDDPQDDSSTTVERCLIVPSMTVTSATAVLDVSKKVVGTNTDNHFTFDLSAGNTSTTTAINNGVVILSTANDNKEEVASTTEPFNNGQTQTIDFGSIKFTQPGTYVFHVQEQGTAPAGWKYDTTVKTITVIVSETETSSTAYNLNATITGNDPVIVNQWLSERQLPMTGSFDARSIINWIAISSIVAVVALVAIFYYIKKLYDFR